jgi:hypothetical protein
MATEVTAPARLQHRVSGLSVDTRIGGFGDVLMRLNGLHALSALRPEAPIRVNVARALLSLAQALYGARLAITSSDAGDASAYTFTHLGLRGIVPELLTGTRLVNPFVRHLAEDTGRSRVKSGLNLAAFSALHGLRRVTLSDPECAETYAGWSQISGLPLARGLAPSAARVQIARDLPRLRDRLLEWAPRVPRAEHTLVLPSGTTFQVMPVAVAKRIARLTCTLFAFHVTDPYQEDYQSAALDVATFQDVNGLLELAASSRRVLSTDSFPSHLMQLYSSRTIVALSQIPSRRVVHPGFDGTVLESTAPCAPCINLTRTAHGRCPTGRAFCSVWEEDTYLHALERALRD